MKKAKDKYRFTPKGVILIGSLCFVSILVLMAFSANKISGFHNQRHKVHSVLHQWHKVDTETRSLLIAPLDRQKLADWYSKALALDEKVTLCLAQSASAGIAGHTHLGHTVSGAAARWTEIKTEYDMLYKRLVNLVNSDSSLAGGDGHGILYSYGYHRRGELSKDKYALMLEIINQTNNLLDKSYNLRENVIAEVDLFISGKISSSAKKFQAGVSVFSLFIIAAVTICMAAALKRSQKTRRILERLVEEKTNQAQKGLEDINKLKKQLKSAFEKSNELAQQNVQIKKSKNEFLAKISREIRTPMSAIIGFSEVLSEENIDEKHKSQIDIIRQSGRSLINIVNDLQDYSRIESGKFKVEFGKCNLPELVDSVIDLFKTTALQKNINLDYYIIDDMPNQMQTDPTRLKQCLINLVSNAVKFTDSGSVDLYVKTQQESETQIRFDVRDTGIGISDDMAESVFQPFYQTQNISKKYGGTGLGLSITKQMAAMLGGTIEFKSSVNKGTVFSLIIPANPPATQQSETLGSPLKVQKPSPRSLVETSPQISTGRIYETGEKLTGKVLVAEDSDTNQSLIKLILSKMGLEYIVVSNGKQAVEKTQNEDFDAILMDIQMPVMNGYEAVKALRQKGFQAPVIALTANAMAGDDRKCFEIGCNDYLAKPINTDKLFSILSKYLPKHNQKTEKEPNNRKGDVKMTNENTSSLNQDTVFIDWDMLISRMGDEELADEIVPVFLTDTIERMQKLAAACENEDCQEVKFYAHAIKGSAGTVGAAEVSAVAAELENAGRDEDTDKIAGLFPRLKELFGGLRDFLDRDDWKDVAKQRSAEKVKSNQYSL